MKLSELISEAEEKNAFAYEKYQKADSSRVSILSGSGIESDIKQKQVEALPLGESMKPETAKSLV